MPTQILDLTESPTTCPSTSPRKPASAQPTLPVTTGAPANGKSYFNNSPEFLEAQGRVLTDIIDHAKEGRLRSVLKSLMAKHWPVAVDWIGKELLASETAVAPFKDGDDDLGNSDLELPDEESDEESDEGSDDDNNDNESEVEKEIDDLGGQIKAPKGENGDLANGKSTDILPAPVTISSGVKRLRSRYATCVNCEAEFDATSNEPGDCIWHEGVLELDDDSSVWLDWEDWREGEMDTESSREEYPEGFIWTCCNKRGGGEIDGCKIGRHKEEPEEVKRPRVMPPIHRL